MLTLDLRFSLYPFKTAFIIDFTDKCPFEKLYLAVLGDNNPLLCAWESCLVDSSNHMKC